MCCKCFECSKNFIRSYPFLIHKFSEIMRKPKNINSSAVNNLTCCLLIALFTIS